MLARLRIFTFMTLIFLLQGCGYNTLQSTDEKIKAAWAEVLNQYQRRADMIPNLVNTVKGYAAHEKEVLTEVTNARARVGAIQATPELIDDPAAFQKFTAAQQAMSSALSRLLVVAEKYPDLKADNPTATCWRSWKARKTALPWPETGISRPSRNTIWWSENFPPI